MADLSLNSVQVKAILDAVAHDKFGAEMMQMDAICYGGDIERLSSNVRHIGRILKAFPSQTVDSYNALLRKEEADKLRAKADAIEQNRQLSP